MNAEEKLKQLREVVALQAEDEMLWALPLTGKQAIGEACLQRALRYLHALIEEKQ